MSESQECVDEVQSHMLGLIVSIMSNYSLTPKFVQDRFEFIEQMRTNCSTNYSSSTDSVDDSGPKDLDLLYVSNRREFKNALSKGIKICSRHEECGDHHCAKFHIKKENLCPHAGRDNYCDEVRCEKVIIKACRKGNHCHDTACSFRH